MAIFYLFMNYVVLSSAMLTEYLQVIRTCGDVRRTVCERGFKLRPLLRESDASTITPFLTPPKITKKTYSRNNTDWERISALMVHVLLRRCRCGSNMDTRTISHATTIHVAT